MPDTLPKSPRKRGRKALAHKHALPDFTPVPRLKQRSNGWKPEVQRAFIEALADTGSVRAACRRVGRSDHGAYMMRRHPQGRSFAKAWDAALQLGVRRLEDIAMDRALNGVEVPLYAYGKIIGSRRVYNDKLLMFILRNRAPERFSGGRGIRFDPHDATHLNELKRQWFTEWTRQQAIAQNARNRERRESWLEDVERLYDRWLVQMSPETRAAYTAFRQSEERDRDEHYEWLKRIPVEDRDRMIQETKDWIAEQKDRPRSRIYRLVDMRPGMVEEIEKDKAIKAARKAAKKAAKEQARAEARGEAGKPGGDG